MAGDRVRSRDARLGRDLPRRAADPWLEVQVRQGAKTWAADAELPNGLLDHRGPGVTIANFPDNAPPQTNSLSYSRWKYVVDLTWPARGRVTVTPVRRGVVVGPWRLGKERVLPAKPPAFVPGTMIWSVPVALGTASGSIEAYGHRIAFHGWQAYHDRTWGRFRLSSTSWAHWDFAVVSPRRGETWILNGLEPTEGGWRSYEKTSAASAGATCCPRRCGRAAEVTRWRSSRSTAAGRSSGCSPAACGRAAHSPAATAGWSTGTPPIPTS